MTKKWSKRPPCNFFFMSVPWPYKLESKRTAFRHLANMTGLPSDACIVATTTIMILSSIFSVTSNPTHSRCSQKRLWMALTRLDRNYLRDDERRSENGKDQLHVAAASRYTATTCVETVDSIRLLLGEFSALIAHCRDARIGPHVDDAFERDLRIAEVRLTEFLLEISDLVRVESR